MAHTSSPDQTSADGTSGQPGQMIQVHSNTGTKESPVNSKKSDNSLWLTAGKVKQHLAESAIFYLIGLCLFLAVLLPIFFKVILPTVIQYFVNNRNVQLQHAHVFLQDANTIQISVNASFESPLPASVDGLSVSLQESSMSEPFARFNIPRLDISRNTQVRIATTQLRITNETGVVRWATDFINREEIPIIALSGQVAVRLGVLEYSAYLDKVVKVRGLQNISIIVDNLKLIAPAKAGGRNIRATFQLMNPSSLTAAVGDLVLGVRIGNLDVASINIQNLILTPGKNTLDIDGNADIGNIIKNLPYILKNQADSLRNGTVQIQLIGKNAAMNGQPIPFLTTLLQVRPVLVDLPLLLVADAAIKVIFTTMTASAESKNIGVVPILNSVSQVLSNKTFLEKIGKHWENKTTSKYTLL